MTYQYCVSGSPQHMNEQYIDLITSFPLFAGFTANGARRLLDSGQVKQQPAGAVLLKEGDPANCVLLVLTGALEVFVDREGQHLTLTKAGPGDVLGELAVLCGITRSASVSAKEDSAVWNGAMKRFAPCCFAILLCHSEFSRSAAHAARERTFFD